MTGCSHNPCVSHFITSGARGGVDFEVLTEVAILDQLVFVSFLEDQIALEHEEIFYLKLKSRAHTRFSGVNFLFCDTIKVIITDSDSKCVHNVMLSC